MACGLIAPRTVALFRRQASPVYIMACRPSLRLLLQCILALCLTCQPLAAEDGAYEEETCVQGFAPAKRTLQAAQRNINIPRTVMSSSEQVRCHHPCKLAARLTPTARILLIGAQCQLH